MAQPEQQSIDNKKTNNNNLKRRDYPKLFHYRFRQRSFNPWDPANWNDRRSYANVNKPGGIGIEGDRPVIFDERKGIYISFLCLFFFIYSIHLKNTNINHNNKNCRKKKCNKFINK